MELAPYQLQIFVSLFVILGAACVALICDFLKGNNEQLRELTIELRVRREEEQKRSHLLTPHVAERAERAPKTEKIAAPAAAAFAAPKERHAMSKEKKRTVNSEALAAMERGAALAGSGMRPRSTPAAPVTESKPEPKTEVMVVAQQTSAKPSAIKKDWGSLLSRNAHGTKPAVSVTVRENLLAAVVAATNSSAAEPSLPAGFQDGFVLNNLVQSHQPVSGLVVSIGVNAARKADGTLPSRSVSWSNR